MNQSENKNSSEIVSEEKKEKPKRKQNELKMYFNNDTQDALVKYQQCSVEDKKTREDLYINRILPAFEKLSENLINIHKFTSLFDSFDDLRNDCVNFLFETIHKFDASRGTNAFSYFNVVAKNWLIIKTKQKSNNFKRNISINDTELLSPKDLASIEDWNIINDSINETLSSREDKLELLIEMLYDIKDEVQNENESICIDAIIKIFENIDNIDLINKNSSMFYIQEISGLSSKQINIAMQMIKKYYKQVKKDIEDDYENEFGE